MISALKGKIVALAPGKAEIDTGSGFIVQALVPVSSYSDLKAMGEVFLHTVLKIKDEEILIYGFLDAGEKRLFEKLISVAGVGGKTALSCLSTFSTAELVGHINSGDVARIVSIPGIGKKTAQRIILELTGKLELEKGMEEENVRMQEDLVSGLVNLGYPARQAREAVKQALKDHPQPDGFETLFKMLLRKMSR